MGASFSQIVSAAQIPVTRNAIRADRKVNIFTKQICLPVNNYA